MEFIYLRSQQRIAKRQEELRGWRGSLSYEGLSL
jgi:hypothetical protein